MAGAWVPPCTCGATPYVAMLRLLLALWGAALLPATGDDGGLSVALKYTLELPLPQHQEDRIVDRLFGMGRQPPTKSMATTSS